MAGPPLIQLVESVAKKEDEERRIALPRGKAGSFQSVTSVTLPPYWAMVSEAESQCNLCFRVKSDKMPLPDLTASVIVRAHEPMTIKPAKQINAIAISLILACYLSCLRSNRSLDCSRFIQDCHKAWSDILSTSIYPDVATTGV